MALIEEWEKTGHFLFRYRGQIPVIFFLIELVFILLHPYHQDYYFFFRSILYLLITLLGFLIRIQTIGRAGEKSSGRNRNRQVAEVLNTSGWYSVVRHPLYFGNFLMWLGLALFSESFCFIILFCLVFWLYYERIMFTEENFLRKKFGDKYLKWASGTSSFIPNFRNYRKPENPFTFKKVLRSEYHILLEIPLTFLILDIIRNYNLYHTFHPDMFWVILLAAGLVLWIICYFVVKKIKRSQV